MIIILKKFPESLLDMIMEPTKIYVNSIKKILHLSGIRGISHITGKNYLVMCIDQYLK